MKGGVKLTPPRQNLPLLGLRLEGTYCYLREPFVGRMAKKGFHKQLLENGKLIL